MKDIEIYLKNASPDKKFLKTIPGGRLKGMTDIKPQWRILALTETFGLVGFGWYYDIVDYDIFDGANGEKIGIININLFVKRDGEWSKPISGTGGNSFVSNEKHGAYTSDEVFKMAISDALSVCCKQLGIASDIYMGYEYSKYTRPEPEPEPKEPKTVPAKKFDAMVKAIKEGERDKEESLNIVKSGGYALNEEQMKIINKL